MFGKRLGDLCRQATWHADDPSGYPTWRRLQKPPGEPRPSPCPCPSWPSWPTAAPSTKSGEVRKVRLPSKQSRHHCKVSGSKHPHEVHARRARLPSDTWHYVVPRPVRICWMTSNLPTRVAKCCRETTSTGIMTRLWAVMRLLFQVVRMGQWQQCPRHVKWNLVGQIQNHFPAARSSWLLGSNVHDLHVSVHTRMRAFPTSLIYIYRHIHVCLCVCHMYDIYIYIFIYLFIYLYLYLYLYIFIYTYSMYVLDKENKQANKWIKKK